MLTLELPPALLRTLAIWTVTFLSIHSCRTMEAMYAGWLMLRGDMIRTISLLILRRYGPPLVDDDQSCDHGESEACVHKVLAEEPL